MKFLGILAILLVLAISGCGGGGGDKEKPVVIRGHVNLISGTTYPVVAIMTLDTNDNWVAISTQKLKPGSGYQSFSLTCPQVASDSVYSIAVFNSKYDDRRYDELTDYSIGSYIDWLEYWAAKDRWIFTDANYNIVPPNADRTDIVIDTYYPSVYSANATKSPTSNLVDKKSAYKAELMKHQGPCDPQP